MLTLAARRSLLTQKCAASTYSGLTSADFMKKKTNEPILEYRKGSKERQDLESALAHYSKVNESAKIVKIDSKPKKKRLVEKFGDETVS